jgi:hypothetical protein
MMAASPNSSATGPPLLLYEKGGEKLLRKK